MPTVNTANHTNKKMMRNNRKSGVCCKGSFFFFFSFSPAHLTNGKCSLRVDCEFCQVDAKLCNVNKSARTTGYKYTTKCISACLEHDEYRKSQMWMYKY